MVPYLDLVFNICCKEKDFVVFIKVSKGVLDCVRLFLSSWPRHRRICGNGAGRTYMCVCVCLCVCVCVRVDVSAFACVWLGGRCLCVYVFVCVEREKGRWASIISLQKNIIMLMTVV